MLLLCVNGVLSVAKKSVTFYSPMIYTFQHKAIDFTFVELTGDLISLNTWTSQ